MKKSTQIALNLFTALTVLLSNMGIAFASISPFSVEAFGIDTIAGYTAQIYSSKTLPNKSIEFTVKKPNGTEIKIPVNSGENGIAEFDLYDYHTKQAGTYYVSAKLENGATGKTNSFYVFPDKVSEVVSEIKSSKLIATSNGVDKIYFTVNLKDKHGNSIKGHEIEVVSSRGADKVQLISKDRFTNENGEVIFSVSSAEDGLSIYSFLDTTSNTVLKKRIEVVYKLPSDVGGFIPVAYAAAGEVSKFIFSDIPSNITANADVKFTLTAVDSDGNKVPNYSGTVHFSADGTNSIYASLPQDYTFDIDIDAGSRTFSGIQSLNFAQEGIYKIVATDLTNFTIRGDANVTVGSGSSTSTTSTTTSTAGNELRITSPTSGTYSSNELVINGTAPIVGSRIKIFDNNSNIGSVEVQSDNTFSYRPSFIIDGPHKFFVVMEDSGGTVLGTSNEVSINVDTTPPSVKSVKFNPSSGIKPGDIISVIVTVDEPVFQGAIVFNIDIAELEVDSKDPTKYIASIKAPEDAGEYSVDVILVDELGNEGAYEDVAVLKVDANGGTTIIEEEYEEGAELEEEPVAVNKAPSDVFGVKAVSSDSKVTLSWQPSTDDSKVVKYKVYYGMAPANLTQYAETFDNRTTWYIPNLNNGNEYFFSIVAIDDEGLESENMSSIVSSIPFSSTPVFVPVQPEQPVVRPSAPVMHATGPEEFWFVLVSIVLAQLYFKFKKKVC